MDRDAFLVDEEGILIGAMGRAPVFDDADAAGGNLPLHAVIEQHHAIRDILLQALSRKRPVAALAGDHGGHAAFLEPAEEALDFRAQHALVGEGRRRGSRLGPAPRASPYLVDRVGRAG